MPLYRVEDKNRVRLIEAKDRRQAMWFAAHTTIKVEKASHRDVHELGKKGVLLEIATVEVDGQQQLPGTGDPAGGAS